MALKGIFLALISGCDYFGFCNCAYFFFSLNLTESFHSSFDSFDCCQLSFSKLNISS